MTAKKQKSFLLASLAFFLTFMPAMGQDGLPAYHHYTLEKLAEGVYAAIHNDNGGYAICNAGIIDLGDKTIIADAFMSPLAARDLKKHAEILTGKPVSAVLNLDPHYDHTRGNQVFWPEADIIGTVNARVLIEKTFQSKLDYDKISAPKELDRITSQLEQASDTERPELIMFQGFRKAMIESFGELKMVPPNITISDTLTMYGTERNLVLIPTGFGHTIGDMVAYLPKDSIIFMGDMFFNERHPFMGNGDPMSWKNTLKKIASLEPKIIVPGHGPIGDVNSLRVFINYFETLIDLVEKQISSGANSNTVKELAMPKQYESWWFGQFYSSNLQRIYDQATKGN